jgi:hypothetical protein
MDQEACSSFGSSGEIQPGQYREQETYVSSAKQISPCGAFAFEDVASKFAMAEKHGIRHGKRYFRGILRVDDEDSFLKAYHEFRNSVDLNKSGILPDQENLVWYILMGVPPVPADHEPAEDGPSQAIEQRVSILKAVFVEANRDQSDNFIDEGLRRYDQAGRFAKALLRENSPTDLSQKT